jgi:hypothetical protein
MQLELKNPGTGIKRIYINTVEGQNGQAGISVELDNGLCIDIDTGHFQAVHWGVGAPDTNYMTFDYMKTANHHEHAPV